jgi:glycosyltransferase involved in cell wall biosynthesis
MLSGTPWAGGAHRQHALARQMAGDRRVLFVNPPGLRPRRRLRVTRVARSMWYADPPVALPLGRWLPPVNVVNRWVIAAALRRWLDQRPGGRLLWVDEDLAAPAIGRLAERRVVYDATDLDWTFTRRANRWHLRAGLRNAVGAADHVHATTAALPRYLPAARCTPVVLANGCDPSRFTPDGPVVPWLSGLPRPRLGYLGAIDTRAFDAELVAALARMCPHWTFVLVGPSTRDGRAPLRELPNVHLYPPVPFVEAPAVLRGCDVGLVPYRLGGLIDYVHPKKCLEYLAAGLPVVATPMPALRGLDAPVELAAGPVDFAAAVARALAGAGDPAGVALRRAAASRHSWTARGTALRALLGALETR